MLILGSIFMISNFASAQMMGKNFMGSKQRGVNFPGNGNKFGGRARDGQVGEAVREVIIRDMCNYSANANNTAISTEFNITTGNSSDFNSCEQCFLATPLSEIFSESGSENASLCTKEYLPSRFQACAVAVSFGNSSSEEISDCYKDALKNSTIEFCSNGTNSSDPVERFQYITTCLRRNKRDFKKEVRMAMMDRVIGGSGCSFSALIALKLFGDKKKGGMKKDMDFEDALDDMLTEELEEDDLEKPFQWTKDRPRRGWKGNKNQGGGKSWNKGVSNNQYNSGNGGYGGEGSKGGQRRENDQGGMKNNGNRNRGGSQGQGNGGRRQAGGMIGQSSGGRNGGNGGFQFQGGNTEVGGRIGGKQKGNRPASDYDYDNNNGGDYEDGDQADGGRFANSQGRGQANRGRGQASRGKMNGGRKQSQGESRGQGFGGKRSKGSGRFGGNGSQGGQDYGNNNDEYDYDNNGGNKDYDYSQG